MEETNDFIDYKLLFGLFFATCGLLLFYILRIFKKDDEQVAETDTKNENSFQAVDKKRDTLLLGKGKKKVAEGRWTGRNDKQGFSHPWLLTTLKGHTGQVLDMEFSSNGKYLASCAEEDPDPGGQVEAEFETNSSGKENSRPSSADPSPRTKGLSRRQRKNRRREDNSPPETKKNKPKPKRNEPQNVNGLSNNKKMATNEPLKQYVRLNIAEQDLYGLLRRYLLSAEQMLAFGYPVESDIFPGKAVIYKPDTCPPKHHHHNQPNTKFDVNAREFVPSFPAKYDSCDQHSGSSSDSGENDCNENLGEDSGDVSESSSCSASSSSSDLENVVNFKLQDFVGASVERKCMRCAKGFFIANENEYLTREKCFYHWGKVQQNRNAERGLPEYSCCRGKPQSRGCNTGRLHVWTGTDCGYNGPYESYVRTRPRKTRPADNNFGVYALDCEMCYTVAGLELTKITVVGSDGRLVYDTFVRPDNEIVDYNTRFSGITAKDLKKSSPKTLRDVQNDLMGFINADTILIGHGLENDLRALRIMHFTVVDTAVAYPHSMGYPFRRALKSLCAYILKKEIQCNNSQGHNSYEDAAAAMELMLWKVRKDYKAVLIHLHP